MLSGSALNDASSATRAPGSSPVRSRCDAEVGERARVVRRRAPARGASARPLRRSGSCAPRARRRRGRPRRSAARSPAPWPLRPRTPAACPRRTRARRAARCASRLDGLMASALSSACRASSCLSASAACSARKTCASTDDGLISSARFASAIACGGLSSDSARAEPRSAGVQRGSICSAIWNDFSASALSYFSRNSSPHAVLIAGVVRRAARRVAERGVGFLEPAERAQRARRRAPSRSDRRWCRRAARPSRASPSRRDARASAAAARAPAPPRSTARARRPAAAALRPRVAAARNRGARLDRRGVRIARIQLVRHRIDLVVTPFVEGARRGAVRRVGLLRSSRRLRGAVRRENEERKRGDQKAVRNPGRHRKSHYRLRPLQV